MTSSSTAKELVAWSVSVRGNDLSSAVVEQARRCLRDSIGCMLAGSNHPLVRTLYDVVQDDGGGRSTVVAGGQHRAETAAYVNGVAAHVLELDDGYTQGGGHPSSPVIPTVLAAAQECDKTGIELLSALAVGLEASSRLLKAGHPMVAGAGYHNTAIAGTIAAAIASAKVFGLNEHQTLSAMGISLSSAGGTFAFLDGASDTKALHAGNAARNGLASARLAMAGVQGGPDPFGGPYGYFAVFGHNPKVPALTDRLGIEWAFQDIYFKVYACCRHLHAPIDLALELMAKERLTTKQIASIEVETYSLAARHCGVSINSPAEAQLSIPYAIASALVLGAADLDSFHYDYRRDAEFCRLMNSVRVIAEPELERQYPANRPARVSILCTQGERHTAFATNPKGEPPYRVSDGELAAKFSRLAGANDRSDKAKMAQAEIDRFERSEDLEWLRQALLT